MRGSNPAVMIAKNIYCTAAIVVLISSFTLCAAGSCLSYGHSCWGAHGKRSGGGSGRPLDSYALASDKRVGGGGTFGDRLLLPRLLNRQMPLLSAKLRSRMLADQQPVILIPQSAEEDPGLIPNIIAVKRSFPEKLYELEDSSKAEQRVVEDGPADMLVNGKPTDFMDNNGNQGLSMGYYKFLKNMAEKSN